MTARRCRRRPRRVVSSTSRRSAWTSAATRRRREEPASSKTLRVGGFSRIPRFGVWRVGWITRCRGSSRVRYGECLWKSHRRRALLCVGGPLDRAQIGPLKNDTGEFPSSFGTKRKSRPVLVWKQARAWCATGCGARLCGRALGAVGLARRRRHRPHPTGSSLLALRAARARRHRRRAPRAPTARGAPHGVARRPAPFFETPASFESERSKVFFSETSFRREHGLARARVCRHAVLDGKHSELARRGFRS